MKADPVLLAYLLIKVAIWAYGLYWAYKSRRVLVCVGFALAMFTSTVISISNAHYSVPSSLKDVAVLLGTPVVACIVGAFVSYRRRLEREGVASEDWIP